MTKNFSVSVIMVSRCRRRCFGSGKCNFASLMSNAIGLVSIPMKFRPKRIASTPEVPDPLKGSSTKSPLSVKTGINVPGIAATYVAGYQCKECIPEFPRLGKDQSIFSSCSFVFKLKLVRLRVETSCVRFGEIKVKYVSFKELNEILDCFLAPFR